MRARAIIISTRAVVIILNRLWLIVIILIVLHRRVGCSIIPITHIFCRDDLCCLHVSISAIIIIPRVIIRILSHIRCLVRVTCLISISRTAVIIYVCCLDYLGLCGWRIMILRVSIGEIAIVVSCMGVKHRKRQ